MSGLGGGPFTQASETKNDYFKYKAAGGNNSVFSPGPSINDQNPYSEHVTLNYDNRYVQPD